jgi:hypothetical protein
MQAYEQENYQYVSYLEQEDSEYQADLEQQGCKYISYLDQDSLVFADFSMDRNACQVYDQFSKHVEHTITDDCIDNYIFISYYNQCVSNSASPLAYDHYFEEGIVAINDQEMIIRELEGYQF